MYVAATGLETPPAAWSQRARRLLSTEVMKHFVELRLHVVVFRLPLTAARVRAGEVAGLDRPFACCHPPCCPLARSPHAGWRTLEDARRWRRGPWVVVPSAAGRSAPSVRPSTRPPSPPPRTAGPARTRCSTSACQREEPAPCLRFLSVSACSAWTTDVVAARRRRSRDVAVRPEWRPHALGGGQRVEPQRVERALHRRRGGRDLRCQGPPEDLWVGEARAARRGRELQSAQEDTENRPDRRQGAPRARRSCAARCSTAASSAALTARSLTPVHSSLPTSRRNRSSKLIRSSGESEIRRDWTASPC